MAIEAIRRAVQSAEPARPPSGERPAADARPAAGIELPPAGKVVPPPERADISRAISNLNRFLEDSRRDILFQLDASSGRTVITIVNPSTGEVVRQIPPEEVLEVARTLRDAGILLSTRA